MMKRLLIAISVLAIAAAAVVALERSMRRGAEGPRQELSVVPVGAVQGHADEPADDYEFNKKTGEKQFLR